MRILPQLDEGESTLSEASRSPDSMSEPDDFNDRNNGDERTSATSTVQNLGTSITRALETDVRELVGIVLSCPFRTNSATLQRSVYESLSVELRAQLRISRSEQDSEIASVLRGDSHVVLPEPSTLLRTHLACPFYLQDKEKHLGCLTRADSRGIADLKEHLWTHHRQPSYCPTCHRTFTINENWDKHVRQRSCTSSDKPRPEGITALQMQMLAQPVDPRISQHDQWLSVWDTTFPGTKAPILIPHEVETAVWALREFWEAEGDKIMSGLLIERQQQHPGLQNQRLNVGRLGLLVRDMAIDQLVAKFRQERDMAAAFPASHGPSPSDKEPRQPLFPP